MQPLVLALAVCSLFACKGDKKKVEGRPKAPAACTSNADCSGTWICLAGQCTNPSAGAIYSDPSNAITPDKVKRQVEDINQQHEQAVDKSLDVE